MKMDMSAKPETEMDDEEMPSTNEGTYDQEQLECMLKYYVQAKKIEADPKILAMVKNYALSKNKMIEELFSPKDGSSSVSSIKDLKKIYNEKVMPKEEKKTEEDAQEDS